MEHFGERLRKAREKRGLSQLDVAQALAKMEFLDKSKKAAIVKYEKGLMYPGAYKLRDICVVLNVSADYLLGLSDKEDLK